MTLDFDLRDIDDKAFCVEDFIGRNLLDFTTKEWFQFAKANKNFHEPGISADELRALHEAFAVFGNRPATIVETGMCFGVTTRYFLVRTLKYGGSLHTFEVMIRPQFKEAMERIGYWNNINVHGHSVRDPWSDTIDFMYIDSEHALADALGEYMRFRVWFTSNTIIGFHDTDVCPGVRKAIEFIQEVDDLELISESTNQAGAGIKFYKIKTMNRYDRPWQKV